MCGRYVITKPVSKIKGIVKSVIGIEDDENYNAHPKQNLPVIKPYALKYLMIGCQLTIVLLA